MAATEQDARRGWVDAVAFLSAFQIGNLDAQAAVLRDVHQRGLPAVLALTLCLAHTLHMSAGPNLPALLDQADQLGVPR
jgi:hypothetical protein